MPPPQSELRPTRVQADRAPLGTLTERPTPFLCVRAP